MMGWREGDLALCFLHFLVLHLVIYGTGGSSLSPPSISPPSPTALINIIRALAPSLVSSQPAPVQHKSLGSIFSQGTQAPNIFNNPDHDISSLNAKSPSTQVKRGAPIGETLGKPFNGSPLTLPHAADLAPRIDLRSPPVVLPNIPSIVPSSGAEGIKGPVMSPAAAPSKGTSSHLSLTNHSQIKGSYPVISPQPHESNRTPVPSASHPHPPEESIKKSPRPMPATSVPVHKEGKRGNLSPNPFSSLPSSAPSGLHRHAPFPKVKRNYVPPVVSPSPSHPLFESPKNKRWHFAPSPDAGGPEVNKAPSHPQVEGPMAKISYSHPHIETPKDPFFPPVQAPITSPSGVESATPASPSPNTRHMHNRWPINYPMPSPSYFRRKPESPLPQPTRALPPPPPNLNCGPITCQEPLVNSVIGSPCACVFPIKVGLSLGVALYTFFPLVSEFAQEIASAVFVKQSQVRIMGANAASEDPERTVVLVDLVPFGKYFDNATVFLTYEKLWHKQVAIQTSYFGDYNVSYVLYPGLPPAPPTAPANINAKGGFYGNDINGRVIRPLGVDVRKKKRKMKLSGSLIAIIVLSSVISLALIVGVAWFFLSRYREHSDLPSASSQSIQPPFAKLSVAAAIVPMAAGSKPSSTSTSFSSLIATYTGSTKKFSLYEIERITNKFDDSRIIGEGGFGLVYEGAIEDGTRVAVKVLKRDDQQGGREFLAEVEMLSRLHHRNLVKLIGICSEENTRCLVYELIPNGSVESHLHGADKEIAPLDWHVRMKIALGAARGLAYLHEDSSPSVIHRDFKSSNILLEHDFTPKVSDFGLARTALDEGNQHISTRVMGTFGYVAPEYAMTGHLLVKSDVYSYGVVLLELLTGRKPVDMSQPPGQENLVSWARPLLTKVERIVDPALGNRYPHDSIVKVMAIASMCVEPEASHRPFMGEVAQALKLICSESYEDSHPEIRNIDGSSSTKEMCQETERGISRSDMLYAPEGIAGNDDDSGLFRMYSSSGPITTGRSKHFWQRVRGLTSRSANEHRFANRWS